MPSARFPTPAVCPICGADVPPRARACPECGADEKTGWDEEATQYDGLDLPAESFTDDETSPNENSPSRLRPPGLAWPWWLAGIFLLAAIIFLVLTGRW